MKKVRNLTAGLLIAAVGVGGFATPATSAEPPLRVKIAPFSGKRVKVARKLKVLLNSNRNSYAKVTISLLTPAGNDQVKGGISLHANSTRVVYMSLYKTGVQILRQNYRQSRLRVYVQVKDNATGDTAQSVKTFRFRR